MAPAKRNESKINKEPVIKAQRSRYVLDTYVGIEYTERLNAPKIDQELIDSTGFKLITLPSQW
jgi:hypothetical protein